MLAHANLISTNFSPFHLKIPSLKSSLQTQNRNPKLVLPQKLSQFSSFLIPHHYKTSISAFQKKSLRQICQSSLNGQDSEAADKNSLGNEKGNRAAEGRDWTTSILLFLLWGALMYYVFNLTPNQTPSRDQYFLEKLLNLRGDDGFRMNQVLVSLWYIMGLWPLVYSMLLIPTGRSSKGNIPLWPFLVLSCIGGAYALLPYFVFWRPPAPLVKETELRKWPLNVFESKLTASILLAAGAGIVIYAGIASTVDWKEFYQYFMESKFIHITCLDFALLSAFAPFWVYNDMSIRKWLDKGFWLLPLSLVPFLGPAFYLVLRPSLLAECDSSTLQNPQQ